MYLEERIVSLHEINRSLENTLEEQQTQVQQAYETRCALQQSHLEIEKKESELVQLRALVRPPNDDVNEVEGGFQVLADAQEDESSQDSETTDDDEEDEEENRISAATSETLLENLSLRERVAEYNVEVDSLKGQLDKVRLSYNRTLLRMESLPEKTGLYIFPVSVALPPIEKKGVSVLLFSQKTHVVHVSLDCFLRLWKSST